MIDADMSVSHSVTDIQLLLRTCVIILAERKITIIKFGAHYESAIT